MSLVNVTETSASVPIQGFKSSSGVFGYFFYTVEIDAYKYAGASANLTGSGKQAILDTGTTLNYLPTDVAADFNSKFTPPAVNQDGFWIVDCNATAPVFTATIGGVDFTVDPRDNILPSGTDEDGAPVCISGTQDGGDPTDPKTIYILYVELKCKEEVLDQSTFTAATYSSTMSFRHSISNPTQLR